MKGKTIVKEIFILALVLVAIGLVLSIILYNYSPSKKALPNKVAYTTPENVSQEISSMSDAEATTPVTITYELDETNIKNSQKSGVYNSGRPNPFGDVNKPEENTKDGESGNTNETVLVQEAVVIVLLTIQQVTYHKLELNKFRLYLLINIIYNKKFIKERSVFYVKRKQRCNFSSFSYHYYSIINIGRCNIVNGNGR